MNSFIIAVCKHLYAWIYVNGLLKPFFPFHLLSVLVCFTSLQENGTLCVSTKALGFKIIDLGTGNWVQY